MAEDLESKTKNAAPVVRSSKVLSDLAVGVVAGIGVNVFIPQERDLSLILIGALGIIPANLLFHSLYASKPEMVVGNTASYAGAVISSILYQLAKY